MKNLACTIIAHRGESFDAPENTMAAVNLAWERGAEAVEVDIQLTSDRELVVIHDKNTKRLSGVDKLVKDQRLDEIRQLDVGAWMDIQWAGEKIPLLGEVLDSVPVHKKLIIEVKSDIQTVPILSELIKGHALAAQQVEFIAFDLKTISLVKETLPDHKALWLLDLDYIKINRIFKPSIKKAIAKAKKSNLDGLNVWAGKMLDQKMIDQVHEAGLLLYCWTVNDVEIAKLLSFWGIDAITTDGAQWLSSHFEKDS